MWSAFYTYLLFCRLRRRSRSCRTRLDLGQLLARLHRRPVFHEELFYDAGDGRRNGHARLVGLHLGNDIIDADAISDGLLPSVGIMRR